MTVRRLRQSFAQSGAALTSTVMMRTLLSALFLVAHAPVNGFVTHLRPKVLQRAPCGAIPLVQSSRPRPSSVRCRLSMVSADGGRISRGSWVAKAVGVAASGFAVAITQAMNPGIASAEPLAGEGGLPSGARQFANLLKVQRDWTALGSTIKSKGAEVSPEEWKNVSLFLRKVYQLGGDLEFIAGGFSPDKKKAALALVRDIQKEVEAADKPAREKNVDAFLRAQGSVEKKFGDFMELFNDVPAEL